ncbi:hypothetical protein PH505_do00030 [Pseudoalteromonas distincta]|nr:hypothetical protein PH505_do00030 [Pseudoalteromonas distincta]
MLCLNHLINSQNVAQETDKKDWRIFLSNNCNALKHVLHIS